MRGLSQEPDRKRRIGGKKIKICICIEYKSNIEEKYSILFHIDKLLLFIDKSNNQIYVFNILKILPDPAVNRTEFRSLQENTLHVIVHLVFMYICVCVCVCNYLI